MAHCKRLIVGFIPVFFLTFFSHLTAQYIIEHVSYEIPISYSLVPEETEFNSAEDEMNFFLNMPIAKLKNAALAEGLEFEETISFTYIDGDKFAYESESGEMGKTTVVTDAKTGRFYTIMWAQKKVMVTTPEDMAEMKKNTEALAEKMMQGLSPEMREQVQAEMDNEKSATPYDIQPTGKKKTINGFDCEGYRIESEEQVVIIWASDDSFGISKEVERMSEKLGQIMNMGTEEDESGEWEYVPGKIPVQVQTFISGMMGEPTISYEIINKIENKKPSPEKFHIPGKSEGFTEMSVMDMMRGIPGFE